MTTKAKTGSYFLPITHSGMQGAAVFIDAKVFSSQRLVRKIDKISVNEFIRVKERFVKIFE